MTPAPQVGTRVRAVTATEAAQSVVVEVTALDRETETGWYVYGYRQYRNRRNGVRSTMIPNLYFVPRVSR